MDELLILPPADDRLDKPHTDNISTTTEADSESEVSREGSDTQLPCSVPQQTSLQNDGAMHSSLFTNDMLYLSSTSPKQKHLSAPPPPVDTALPSQQQEFGNYPLLTSLLGNSSSSNQPNGGPSDVAHNFMAPGDMYYPLRDLTRLTPTMTSLPSSLTTVVGDTGVRKVAATKSKAKTTTHTQQKTAPTNVHKTVATTTLPLDKKGQRVAAANPPAANGSSGSFSAAAAVTATGAATTVKKKGNGKPVSDAPKSLKKSPERKNLAARPDHAALFAQSVLGHVKPTSAGTTIKKSVSAPAQGTGLSVVTAQDSKADLIERVALAVDSVGSTDVSVAPGGPMTSQQAKMMLANAAAELARSAPGAGYKHAPQPIAKSVINLAGHPSVPARAPPAGGVGRPSLADLEKFKEVTKKETKKELKMKKDAAQQQAFAASMLAASSALSSRRAQVSLAIRRGPTPPNPAKRPSR
jgi:hypothetical protein